MSFIAAEYDCPEHGRFTKLVERPAPDALACIDCGEPCEWVMSAPLCRVKRGEVHRGKSDPHPPNALDTRPLADGMPYEEWASKEDNKSRDIRLKAARSKVS